MLVSRKAASRRSVHWPVVVVALSIAMPAVVGIQGCCKAKQPVPLTIEATHGIGFYPWRNEDRQELACPAPTSIIVERRPDAPNNRDKVVFENLTGNTVTVTTIDFVFVDVPENGSFDVPPMSEEGRPGTVTKTVSSTATTGQVRLQTKYMGHTAEGCPGLPQDKYGPGMQVND
jgi:hypothetical protein